MLNRLYEIYWNSIWKLADWLMKKAEDAPVKDASYYEEKK